MHGTPWCASSSARTPPTGPAPTMSTAVDNGSSDDLLSVTRSASPPRIPRRMTFSRDSASGDFRFHRVERSAGDDDPGHLHPAAHPQFGEDVPKVAIDGMARQRQFLGDLTVLHAPGDQAGH